LEELVAQLHANGNQGVHFGTAEIVKGGYLLLGEWVRRLDESSLLQPVYIRHVNAPSLFGETREEAVDGGTSVLISMC
jgi:hypothetical protein